MRQSSARGGPLDVDAGPLSVQQRFEMLSAKFKRPEPVLDQKKSSVADLGAQDRQWDAGSAWGIDFEDTPAAPVEVQPLQQTQVEQISCKAKEQKPRATTAKGVSKARLRSGLRPSASAKEKPPRGAKNSIKTQLAERWLNLIESRATNMKIKNSKNGGRTEGPDDGLFLKV